MKMFQKIILISTIIVCLFACSDETNKQKDIADFIPENSDVVFKINNLETLQTDLKNNSLIEIYKDMAPYKFFSNDSKLLSKLKPSGQSLLCIHKRNDTVLDYTFITRQTGSVFVADSLKNIKVETLTYDEKVVQKITLDAKVTFMATKDSIFIASSSQQIIDAVLEGKTETDKDFKKIYNLDNKADLRGLFRHKPYQNSDSTTINVASWTSMNIVILPNSLTANGVMTATDSLPQLINVFKGQIPQKNELAKIVPNNAKSAYSFTFSDPEKLRENLRIFLKDKTKKKEKYNTVSFGSINEIGNIELTSGIAIILKSLDASLTNDALASIVSENGMFREVAINNLDRPNILKETFSPLVNAGKLRYIFQLDSFFVATENMESAEAIIIAYKNNDVLSETEHFKEASASVGTASSLVFYGKQQMIPKNVSAFFNLGFSANIAKVSLKAYPLAIFQLSYDRDFAHVSMVFNESSNTQNNSANIKEAFNITLENEVLGSPVFLGNSKNGNDAIAVQDVTNMLYLISNKGKILWKNNIGSPILGKIQEVDMNRNGQQQLAFATRNKLFVIDKNGKDLKSFPITYKDEITQPLSVFDYDNNRKYRFMVTQGKNILLYDNEGKQVKGFDFKGAKSKITMAPQHIRMGNKDYILIAEENGKLNILSRVGKSRVTVSEKFNFTEIPIAEENNTFVVITKDNKKVSISQSGKTSAKKLDISSTYSFSIDGSTKVTLDDNLLLINGNLTELPFGVYSKPAIYSVGKKTYITVTETQENKVYLYTKNGDLVTGFPIYGANTAVLNESRLSKNIDLVVKGGTKEIILYKTE